MPQFLQAASTNEVLTVTMEFWDTDAKGKARLHYTVKLTDATIGEIRQRLVDDTLTQDVAFFFRSSEVDDNVGKTSYFDDWSGVL